MGAARAKKGCKGKGGGRTSAGAAGKPKVPAAPWV